MLIMHHNYPPSLRTWRYLRCGLRAICIRRPCGVPSFAKDRIRGVGVGIRDWYRERIEEVGVVSVSKNEERVGDDRT